MTVFMVIVLCKRIIWGCRLLSWRLNSRWELPVLDCAGMLCVGLVYVSARDVTVAHGQIGKIAAI